ncbi:MAG: hypothetical protein AAFQ42_05530 [Pseudomonadota bacterium]
MARILAVHGTFAQWEIDPGSAVAGPPPPQWWQSNSAFAEDMHALVASDLGPIEIEALEWSSENSERDRRRAATNLYKRVLELEAAEQPYCIVGHSHGGSIISTMLLRAARAGNNLPHMRRWISVGTPFLEMQREKFLFSRLPLLLKAAYVASLMLFMMFVTATVADIVRGDYFWTDRTSLIWFLLSFGLTALPAVIFSLAQRWQQGRQLFAYRPKLRRRAAEMFADRWLALTHEDDEVVTGLTTLSRVDLDFFQKNFAVAGLTFGAVFILPLAYLFLLTSPTTMRGISAFLQAQVYDVAAYERDEPDFREFRREIRKRKRTLETARERMNNPLNNNDQRSQGQTDVELAQRDLRTARRKFRSARKNYDQTVARAQERFPELPANARALSFKEKFLLRPDGSPCRNRVLCGGGRDVGINARLLFHLVTDEISRLVLDDAEAAPTWQAVLSYAIPIVLVPILFMLLAVILVKLAQLLASLLSRIASRQLDRLTWAQVKRTALGNDTEGEVATGAARSPAWINATPPRLPTDIAEQVTDYSNEVTTKSLAKFRNALSELTFADRSGADQNAVLKFFTWRELVHAAYFEVPLFRKLIASAVAREAGFSPTPTFTADPDYQRLGDMLSSLDGTEKNTDYQMREMQAELVARTNVEASAADQREAIAPL